VTGSEIETAGTSPAARATYRNDNCSSQGKRPSIHTRIGGLGAPIDAVAKYAELKRCSECLSWIACSPSGLCFLSPCDEIGCRQVPARLIELSTAFVR